jgi:uncharacterized protein (TIGR03083 family)
MPLVDPLPTEMAGYDPFDLLDVESDRVDRFYRSLRGDDWQAPTRCADWNRLQLLAHLASIEDYTRAGLTETVADLMSGAPSSGMDEFNDWGVGQRADLPPEELLAEWRRLSISNRQALREKGVDGTLDTAVGPYPLGRQVFYLASELAIHGDDAGAVTPEDERAARQEWRVRFARAAIAEVGRGVSVEVRDGGQLVRLGSDEAFLDDATLVEAASGRLEPGARLPDGGQLPPALHKALVALA